MKQTLNDNELVAEYIRTTSKQAFGKIYAKYLKVVYGYIYCRVGNKEACEDIVSETFLTLIDVLKNFDSEAKLSTFIIGIAINKMRQYFDKKKLTTDLQNDFDEGLVILDQESNSEVEENYEVPLEDDSQTNLIKELLLKLGEIERSVLEFRFLQTFSIKETAVKMNLTEANVRVIQHRAIAKLKDLVIMEKL